MNEDKIYEAYTGRLGKAFQESTVNRINWILSNVNRGDTVLDIGCSQGIISILAAQKAKSVTGIDIEASAIETAQKILVEEYKELSDKVVFFCEDFMESHIDKKYDRIIITEVIEHLNSPEDFLRKADSCLNSNGTIILSVPLGISDHPDHKITFYLSNFTTLLTKFFSIKEIVFIDRWIGAIVEVGKCNKVLLTESLLESYDSNRLMLDRETTDRVNSLYQNSIQANQKYKEALENYATAKKWLESKSISLKKNQEDYITLFDQLKAEENNRLKLEEQYSYVSKSLESEKQNFEKLQAAYNELRLENESFKKNISIIAEELKYDYYDFGEDLLLFEGLKKRIQQLEIQNNYLKSENNEYRRKIQLITDTTLGKIGLKIYHWLKKIKRR